MDPEWLLVTLGYNSSVPRITADASYQVFDDAAREPWREEHAQGHQDTQCPVLGVLVDSHPPNTHIEYDGNVGQSIEDGLGEDGVQVILAGADPIDTRRAVLWALLEYRLRANDL